MSNLELNNTTLIATSNEQSSSSAIVASCEATTISDINPLACQQQEEEDVGSEIVNLEEGAFVIKAPRANSKLILQNMEEVLNSVKKKHRQKHRRKKEQKKLALLAEEELQRSSAMSNDVSTSASKLRKHKKPLQEQQILQAQHDHNNHVVKVKNSHGSKRQNSTVSPLKSLTSTGEASAGSILQHIIRTPKKRVEVEGELEVKHQTIKPLKAATNAFEVMMNARNKSIGSNTPGKEPSPVDSSPGMNGDEQKSSTNAKRKLLLQSWSERKGGLKRKLEEEMRAAYVDEQLENRAKRLKHMLTNGSSPHTNETAKQRKTNSDLKSTFDEGHHSTAKKISKSTSKSSRKSCIKESLDDGIEEPSKVDSETETFLSRLSSPTKKRDSLLGYFPKVPSPRDNTPRDKSNKTTILPETASTGSNLNKTKEDPNQSETPKRRGRPLKMNLAKAALLPENAVADEENNSQLEETAMRPKRNCARKTIYDYDLEDDESPKKAQRVSQNVDRTIESGKSAQRRSARVVNSISTVQPENSTDIEIITLDDSTSDMIENTPKKLAPLFLRNVPKPNPDPETLKARQEFLRSGVPEKLRLEQDKQKQFEQNYEETLTFFPDLSHVTQWSPTQVNFLIASTPSSFSFRYSWTEEALDYTSNDMHRRSMRAGGSGRKSKNLKTRAALIGITDCTAKDYCPQNKTVKSAFLKSITAAATLSTINNKRLIVKSWKNDFDRFPTYKCYNQLRAKYRFFSALDSTQDTEQVTESFVVTRSTRTLMPRSLDNGQEDDVKPPATAPNGELLFVEKYKPLLFEQVLVNLTPVAQLREFLSSWGNGSSGGSLRNSQNTADDSLDFLNDSSSSQQSTCNSVVLLGPASSGKTNAVFTLANEMNFNVLEINAGMKRTGKKLIQELQEATQSHQIRNESRGGSAIKSKAQKHLLKMSLNGLKNKKQNNVSVQANDGAIGAANDLNSRKCLILIEDADIVFEQTDAGFTDAIYTLAASSKRPVIVIATNPNCVHLQRLMNQNTITFTAPNVLSISKYLAVLSLMENCPVSLDDLISLYLFNNNDLRKTLHELQFFIQSGGDRERQLLNGNDKSQQQRTPQKNISTTPSEDSEATQSGKFFASPSKRRFSEDPQLHLDAELDEQLKREVTIKQQPQQQQLQLQCNDDGSFYTHRTLFEFYTVNQNEKWRVPFPVNFDLFYSNLNDIFGVAKKLIPSTYKCSEVTRPVPNNAKRKTRSPKKAWLSAATSNETQTANHGTSNMVKPLDALSAFYNNISVAALLVTRDENGGRSARLSGQYRDRLTPYLSEFIAHDVLEHAINVNLDAEHCPYNLFDAPKKTSTICDLMGNAMGVNSRRARAVDCEPALRAICRSESQRSSQERRSTRFYHYLRNCWVDNTNFSQRTLDTVCSILQEQHPSQQIESKTKPEMEMKANTSENATMIV